jgi:hypothetical protein
MIIKIDSKSGYELVEYNGTYSLCAMYDGYKKWAQYSIGKDKYEHKARPVKVVMGDKVQTVQGCLDILLEITGKQYAPEWS